ncbi:MFS transporter [Nicoliella lavandulae]|uniref:MFS transporter n=1 Tax=Nicoliella lavandulae TaxID=3082954 RepID=A0ABU8SM49_9LACO
MQAHSQKFGMVLPIVLIVFFMILIDNSVVFTSSDYIEQTLHLTSQTIDWISNIYTLTFGSFILFGGRLGDIWGRKTVLIIGLLLFGITSLIVGLSINFPMIVIARAAQGIGAAILAPTMLAIIMDNYQGQMRAKAIQYYSLTAGIGASIGFLFGGIINTFLSWRYGFLINVPISFIMIGLAIKYISNRASDDQKLDITGTILSSLGLLLLVYSINGTTYRLIALGLAVILLVLFIQHENGLTNAMIPLSIFNNPVRNFAYLARFLDTGIMITYLFLVPEILQSSYHFTPLVVAFALLAQMIPQFISSLFVDKFIQHLGLANTAIMGSIAMAIGLAAGVYLPLHLGFSITFLIPVALIGFGQGVIISPLTSYGIAYIHDHSISGAASGMLNMAQQIGSAVCLAITVTLTSNIITVQNKYQMESVILTVMALLVLVLLLGIKRKEQKY